jgi:diacylglycerol kinase family enzyme
MTDDSTAPAAGVSAPSSNAALFVVFNVGSGAGNAADVRSIIETGCTAAGRELHLMSVDDPQRLGAIAAEAVKRAQGCGGIVVAAGGDGTINAVAQAVLGSGCAFGVLPQGTFNYFSRTHNIPFDTAQALQVLLHEQPQDVQVGLVNDRVFLVNASLGLYPKLLEERENWKHHLGRNRVVAFASAFATLMGGHRSLRLHIAAQGKPRKLRTPTLFVGNNALQMKQLGFSLAEDIDNGELAAIVLKPVRRLAMLGLLMRGALGQLGSSERVLSFPFRHLVVNPAWPLRTRRIKVATDGEITWLQMPLEFRVAPQPLRLIRPAGQSAERKSA